MNVRISPYAWGQLQALTAHQQAQARRLLSAIVLANGTVGRPWNRDLKGRQQWIASALDTHVIFRVVFHQSGDTLYITAVLVFPTPPDPNNA
jgi:hypothetical protein